MSEPLVARVRVCEQLQNDRPIFWFFSLIQKHAVHFELELPAIKGCIVVQKLARQLSLVGFKSSPALFQPGVILQTFKHFKSCHKYMIIESFLNLDEFHP